MKKCPLCGYLMDAFDIECRRCHGKGIAVPAPQVAPPMAPVSSSTVPLPAPAPPLAPTAPAPPLGPTGLPPFFLVAHEPGWGTPKLFRVYLDADALLFIDAGPYHMNMKDNIKRERGEASATALHMAEGLGRGIATAARVGGLAGGAVVGGAAIVAGGLVAVGGMVAEKERKKRGAILDALTLDQLREEAASGKGCFRIERANTSKVQLRPISRSVLSNDEPDIAGYLRFVHAQKGKWKLKLITLPDAYDAVVEFRRIIGPDQIESQFPF